MRRTLADLVDPQPHLDLSRQRSDVRGPPLLGEFDSAACLATASSLNFAAADGGGNIVATRFRSCDSEDPPTLYMGIAWGDAPSSACGFSERCGLSRLQLGGFDAQMVWIASEPLDRVNGSPWPSPRRSSSSTSSAWRDTSGPRWWGLLPKDAMVEFDAGRGRVTISCLSAACRADVPWWTLGAKQAASMVVLTALITLLVVLLRHIFPNISPTARLPGKKAGTDQRLVASASLVGEHADVRRRGRIQ